MSLFRGFLGERVNTYNFDRMTKARLFLNKFYRAIPLVTNHNAGDLALARWKHTLEVHS